MFSALLKSACMQSSATVGRTDTIDYRPCITAWDKKWGSVHNWTPTA